MVVVVCLVGQLDVANPVGESLSVLEYSSMVVLRYGTTGHDAQELQIQSVCTPSLTTVTIGNSFFFFLFFFPPLWRFGKVKSDSGFQWV